MSQTIEKSFVGVCPTQPKNPLTSKVSAVIITYNESWNISRTLSQLYWCDEVIIVDSFSTDGTQSIAREHGCKVIQRAFKGFGDQKSFAISQTKNDWVLCLDADEYLTDDLAKEIVEVLHETRDVVAFAMPSNLVFRNHRFRCGKESKRYVVRLFDRRYANVSNDRVHEKIVVHGKIERLHHPILHYSYRDITHYFAKFDIYTDWCAEKYYLRGKRKSKSMIAVSIPYYFFKYYLLDMNILNGINGFYWSVLMSFYHFVKYIKLEDMYLNFENSNKGFYRECSIGCKSELTCAQ
jgi:glycosyltransferase involved in cell wall biosynthesis